MLKIGQAAETKATTAPDGVVRIGWARTDVAVKVDGMPLKPFAGLGSWAAFTPTEHGAMVMGDTLLFTLGRHTGWTLLGLLCRVSVNPETCILRSAESFYRRGKATLVLAKFNPRTK